MPPVEKKDKPEKKDKTVMTETVTLQMRWTDYFWCFLGLVFLGMSAVICQKITTMRVTMMNPENFKPEWFKNSNGETVKTQSELK